jgi:heterodisulfide reductase subunit C
MTEGVQNHQKYSPETGVLFQDIVQESSGEDIRRCYYCQECSVGCPTACAMDIQPAQLLKMVQLGMKEAVLSCTAIWLCVGCETCGTRCPNGISIAPVMDVLKQMALAEGYEAAEPNSLAFHRSFVDSIHYLGRVHEITMLAEYKLRSLDLLSDLDLGVQMSLRSKLALWPKRVKRLGEVRELLSRFQPPEER